MVVMKIVSYLSDQQYHNKKVWRQLLPRPHGSLAPFSSFLSLTTLLVFLHIEAPVCMKRCHLIDQIYAYLISAIRSTSDYSTLQPSSRSQAVHRPGKTLCDPFKSLHNAAFVNAMHKNADRWSDDGFFWTNFYTAYQYQTLHNVLCLKNNFDYY